MRKRCPCWDVLICRSWWGPWGYSLWDYVYIVRDWSCNIALGAKRDRDNPRQRWKRFCWFWIWTTEFSIKYGPFVNVNMSYEATRDDESHVEYSIVQGNETSSATSIGRRSPDGRVREIGSSREWSSQILCYQGTHIIPSSINIVAQPHNNGSTLRSDNQGNSHIIVLTKPLAPNRRRSRRLYTYYKPILIKTTVQQQNCFPKPPEHNVLLYICLAPFLHSFPSNLPPSPPTPIPANNDGIIKN